MNEILLSIIIPNYNGKDILDKNLPSILEAQNGYSNTSEIIIIDDKSTDESIDFLNSKFPQIKIIQNKHNEGFAFTCNRGAREARGKTLFFLNSDIEIESDIFEKLMINLDDRNVFAVVPKILNRDSNFGDSPLYNESITTASFKGGFVSFNVVNSIRRDLNFDTKCEVFWACGGAFLVLKQKFLDLGGFDEIYSPGYIEDVDLSYKAWKKGWKIFYEPEAVVYHDKGSTIEKKFNVAKIKTIYRKHLYYFIWKNINNKIWLIHHVFYIILRHICLDIREIVIIWKALFKLRQVLVKRRICNKDRKLSDKEVFTKFDRLNEMLKKM